MDIDMNRMSLLETMISDLDVKHKQLVNKRSDSESMKSQIDYYEKNWKIVIQKHLDHVQFRKENIIKQQKKTMQKARDVITRIHQWNDGESAQDDNASEMKRLESDFHQAFIDIESELKNGTYVSVFDPFGEKQINALQRQLNTLKTSMKTPFISKESTSIALTTVMKENKQLREEIEEISKAGRANAKLIQENKELREIIADMDVKRIKRENVFATMLKEMRENDNDAKKEDQKNVAMMYEAKQEWMKKYDDKHEKERESMRKETEILKTIISDLRRERDDMYNNERTNRLTRERNYIIEKDQELGRLLDEEREKQRIVLIERDSEVTKLQQQLTKANYDKSEYKKNQHILEIKLNSLEIQVREQEHSSHELRNELLQYEEQNNLLKNWNQSEIQKNKVWQDKYMNEKKEWIKNTRIQFKRKVAIGIAQIVKSNFNQIKHVSKILTSTYPESSTTSQQSMINSIRDSIFHNNSNSNHNDISFQNSQSMLFHNHQNNTINNNTIHGTTNPVHDDSIIMNESILPQTSTLQRTMTMDNSFFDISLDLESTFSTPMDHEEIRNNSDETLQGGLYASTSSSSSSSLGEDPTVLLNSVTEELHQMLNENIRQANNFVETHQESLRKQSSRYRNMLTKIKDGHMEKINLWSRKHKELAQQLNEGNERIVCLEDMINRLKSTLEIKTKEVSQHLNTLEKEKDEYLRLRMEHMDLKDNMQERHIRAKSRLEMQYKDSLDELTEAHENTVKALKQQMNNIISEQKEIEEKWARSMMVLEDKLKQEQETNEILAVDKYSLEKNLRELIFTSKEKEAEMQRSLYQAQRQMKQLTQTCNDFKKELQVVQEENKKQSEQLTNQEILNDKITDYETENIKLKTELNETKEKLIQSEDSMDSVEEERRIHLELAAAAQSKIHEYEAIIETYEDQVDKYVRNSKVLDDQVRHHAEAMEKSKMKIEELTILYDNKVKEYIESKKQMNILNNQYKNAKESTISLQLNICGHNSIQQKHQIELQNIEEQYNMDIKNVHAVHEAELQKIEEKHSIHLLQMQGKIMSLTEKINQLQNELITEKENLNSAIDETAEMRNEFQTTLNKLVKEETDKWQKKVEELEQTVALKEIDEEKNNNDNTIINNNTDNTVNISYNMEKENISEKEFIIKPNDKNNNQLFNIQQQHQQQDASKQNNIPMKFRNPFDVVGPTATTVQLTNTGMLTLGQNRIK